MKHLQAPQICGLNAVDPSNLASYSQCLFQAAEMWVAKEEISGWQWWQCQTDWIMRKWHEPRNQGNASACGLFRPKISRRMVWALFRKIRLCLGPAKKYLSTWWTSVSPTFFSLHEVLRSRQRSRRAVLWELKIPWLGSNLSQLPWGKTRLHAQIQNISNGCFAVYRGITQKAKLAEKYTFEFHWWKLDITWYNVGNSYLQTYGVETNGLKV